MTESVDANWFAYVAILAWPILALILYSTTSLATATVWTVLGALLFLPSHAAIKIPMIPAIDKDSVGNLAAVVGCVFVAAGRKRLSTIGLPVAVLAAIYIISPVITSVLNNDPIVAGPRVIPGVGYYDGVSALLSQTIAFIPFFLGLRFLCRSEDVETTLRMLVLAGLIYSLPMLFEVRMSPQLSHWIYGYFPSAYAVEMRYGGFRPVVFLGNGLIAAFFMATTFIAAAALWRTRTRAVVSLPPAGISAYFGFVLVLCKSAGALVYAALIGALVHWFRPKSQVRIAVLLASIAAAYPLLRMADCFPNTQLVELASVFNEDRAKSLEFRFDQEQRLLEHSSERIWFGWGRYGRNRLYNENGDDISVTDGQWILTVGQFGLLGFIAQFGLLTLPVFRAWSALRYFEPVRERILIAALTLVVALAAIEQLPNASISPWSWLLGGALYGCSETASLRRRARRSAPRITELEHRTPTRYAPRAGASLTT
jgi:hypothetical protein